MKQWELEELLTPTETKVWFAVSKEKKPDTFTKLIQKFQGTTYSHALAIYYSLDFGDYVIANAHGKASQLDTLKQFHEVDEVEYIFEKQINISERLKFIRAVVELDGIDYSEKQIFEIGLNALFGWQPTGNGIDGIICSEYADRLSMASGLESAVALIGKHIDIINPKDNVKCWDMQTRTNSNFRRLK